MSPPLSDLNGLVHMQTLEGDSLHVSELGHQLLVARELLVEPAHGHSDDNRAPNKDKVHTKVCNILLLRHYSTLW